MLALYLTGTSALAPGVGIICDVLLGRLPPATFSDWRYLAVAAGGGLITFLFGRHLERLNTPITLLDAAGLSLFAVTGASKAIDLGLGPAQAVILGTITGVGGSGDLQGDNHGVGHVRRRREW